MARQDSAHTARILLRPERSRAVPERVRTPTGTPGAMSSAPRDAAAPPMVLIGEGPLAEDVERTLIALGAPVRHLRRPGDRELRRALEQEPAVALVISRDDIAALHAALLIQYLRPGIRLIVTIFDRTVAGQVRRAIPTSHVLSMADASVGAVLGPCVDPALVSLHRERAAGTAPGGPPRHWIAVHDAPDGPRIAPFDHRPPSAARRLARRLSAQLRPYDRIARVLVLSLAGLLGLVAIETVLAVIVGHESFVTGIYGAAKTIVTVGPSASRTVPRRDHVVVVGLGQVGFRLCLELRALGVDVVAVESNPQVRHVALARGLRVPVVIARGGDRLALERLSLPRARALAAVTSDEYANIAISVTALAVEPTLRTVLRAGTNDVTRETQALFPVGVPQDLQRIAAAALAATALGRKFVQAFEHGGVTYLHLPDGSVAPFPSNLDPAPRASDGRSS